MLKFLAEQLGRISQGVAINLPVVENLRRNIRSAPGKESTTTSYEHCNNTRFPYRVPKNSKRGTGFAF